MKKHLIVLCLILYVIVGGILLSKSENQLFLASANQDKPIYAKISVINTPLLKTPSNIEDYSNVYFLLEETYYVKILSKINSNFYYVDYNDIHGYVNSAKLTLVNEQIENPFLTNIKFKISKECYLFSEPKNFEKNQIQKLSLDTNVTFIGKIFSDEIFKNSGNEWYYSKVSIPSGDIYGYIHCANTSNLSPIDKNKEYSTTLISSEQNSLLNLSVKTQSLVITIISVPIIFLLFIFLKGFKKV